MSQAVPSSALGMSLDEMHAAREPPGRPAESWQCPSEGKTPSMIVFIEIGVFYDSFYKIL